MRSARLVTLEFALWVLHCGCSWKDCAHTRTVWRLAEQLVRVPKWRVDERSLANKSAKTLAPKEFSGPLKPTRIGFKMVCFYFENSTRTLPLFSRVTIGWLNLFCTAVNRVQEIETCRRLPQSAKQQKLSFFHPHFLWPL